MLNQEIGENKSSYKVTSEYLMDNELISLSPMYSESFLSLVLAPS